MRILRGSVEEEHTCACATGLQHHGPPHPHHVRWIEEPPKKKNKEKEKGHCMELASKFQVQNSKCVYVNY
ncbi:hypothetical protein CsatA_021288 [Cannabis sativa]